MYIPCNIYMCVCNTICTNQATILDHLYILHFLKVFIICIFFIDVRTIPVINVFLLSLQWNKIGFKSK